MRSDHTSACDVCCRARTVQSKKVLKEMTFGAGPDVSMQLKSAPALSKEGFLAYPLKTCLLVHASLSRAALPHPP